VPDLEERVAALEAAVAALPGPEPDFMQHVREEPLGGDVLTVRLTHEPTGVTVAARDRAEGVFRLQKALAGKARREYDLQEAEREQQRKAAAEASGAA
jgi:protein subunit release factor A